MRLMQVVLIAGLSCGAEAGVSQVPSAATAKPTGVSQRGTVKAIVGDSLTLTTDAGAQVVVTVPNNAKLVQVAPGSKDLSGAQVITLTDIAVGDKVLVSGKAGETVEAFSAGRVILMKSGDIAQKHAAEQVDWQKRGMGGIVTAVDPSSSTVTVSAGAKKVQVKTVGATVFQRYAPDSIKFEDAKPGTFTQVQVGDQLEVRGAKTADGSSVDAEEVVSGSFRNLSGTLASVNATAGTVTLKDLTTKKTLTVTITANSDVRKLPPEIAARFAAKERGGSGAPGSNNAGPRPAGAAGSASGPAGAPGPSRTEARPGGAGGAAGERPSGTGNGGGMEGSGGARAVGMDLSKMLTRLPTSTLADLHTGDAVMIVASQGSGDAVTAVTVLGGVEPILAATPSGGQAMTLSPWSVGSGAPEGGGGPN